MEDVGMRAIQEIVQPLLHRQAWNVKQGIGSFITMEFGDPLPLVTPRKRVHGEWHLWVMHCSWLLSRGPELLAASEDRDERITLGLQRIEGARLTCITVRPPALDTTIRFNDDVSLRLFPCATREYEHWMLFTPDHNVLVVGPGSRWRYQREDEP